MKLIKTKEEVSSDQQYPGLLSMEVKHKIASTVAHCDYTGPKIPPLVWQQILSFFRWTYNSTKSECQVRLYVNPNCDLIEVDGSTTKGTWAAWAYPQEARSGMSARELDTPEAKVQREQFSDEAGWVYFGTVHHHCSAGAFQSGTDENNEKNQDGIHITIGNMDKDRHDMHARFYLKGLCFEPNMALFWDIGTQMRELLPSSLWDGVARHQMCASSTVEFPTLWRENLIERKEPVHHTGGTFHTGWAGGTTTHDWRSGTGWTPHSIPPWKRAMETCYELARTARRNGWKWDDVIGTIKHVLDDDCMQEVFRAMRACNVTDLDEVAREMKMPTVIRECEEILTAPETKKEETNGKSNGIHVPRDITDAELAEEEIDAKRELEAQKAMQEYYNMD